MNASSSDIFYFYTELLKNRLNLLMENGLSRLLSLYIHSCVKLFKSITTKLLTKQSNVFIIMFFTNVIYCNITYRLLVMLDTLLVIQPPEHFFIYIRPVHTQKKCLTFNFNVLFIFYYLYLMQLPLNDAHFWLPEKTLFFYYSALLLNKICYYNT